MFTIFHVLLLVGMVLGGVFGYRLGVLVNIPLGIVGAIVGVPVGFLIGQLPLLLSLRFASREFQSFTVDELRVMLKSKEHLAPNLLLLELASRGEDIEPDLPIVIELLTAESPDDRMRGWHALASAFPDRAQMIKDYRFTESRDMCRKRALPIMPAATEGD